MAEYIDIDAPIDVAVYQRNRRIQVTLRQILESNDAKYECSDVVERKKGKWIKLYAGNYKCSVCGDWWSNDDNEMVEDFKYCPNCGADMRGPKDD